MKQIELVPALELGNKLNVDVMDFPKDAGGAAEGAADDAAEGAADGAARPAGPRRKRCGITLEYAPRDVRELREQGMDPEAMLEYYRKRVYDLVKLNISQDWACCGGMDEVLQIVRKHIEG